MCLAKILHLTTRTKQILCLKVCTDTQWLPNGQTTMLILVQWSLYFKTTHGTKKMRSYMYIAEYFPLGPKSSGLIITGGLKIEGCIIEGLLHHTLQWIHGRGYRVVRTAFLCNTWGLILQILKSETRCDSLITLTTIVSAMLKIILWL